MKITSVHNSARACVLAAICLAIVLIATQSPALTVSYDAYANPNTLPSASGFTIITGASGDSETVSGSLLTIIDTGTGNGSGYVWNLHSLTSGQISSNSTWEARARMRLASYSGTAFGFVLEVEDGAHVSYGGVILGPLNAHQFFIGDANNNPATVPFTPVPTGDDFYDIFFRKVGTSGTAADTLELYVEGQFAGSTSYANTFAGTSLGRNVFFGNPFGGPAATTELTGASFGIGEAAPLLIPEPSVAALCLFGALFGWMKLRRR